MTKITTTIRLSSEGKRLFHYTPLSTGQVYRSTREHGLLLMATNAYHAVRLSGRFLGTVSDVRTLVDRYVPVAELEMVIK